MHLASLFIMLLLGPLRMTSSTNPIRQDPAFTQDAVKGFQLFSGGQFTEQEQEADLFKAKAAFSHDSC
jgi:hypothetical protein